ncbi:hypothetical protein N665_1218s0002 [Sinapis alba]|nr:hypothetical protein N665_1218s0002 [Sinapis alba]
MATEYERKRLENFRRHNEMMASLNVHAKASLLSASTKRSRDQSKPLKKKKKQEPETTIDFNLQNPNLMATSSQDRSACLWDLRTIGAKKPKALTTVNHGKAVYSAYFSPSGLSLATTSRHNYVGVLSGANFEDTSMICHINNTARYISSFRGVWGWDDSHIFVGNVAKGIGSNQTKGIDVISTKLKRTVKKLQSPLVKEVISRLHCHPLNVGMLAGSTAGGHVYVWTTK